ncbi:MAG: type II secretion system GspH family protein [Campylobacter sp.]|nr:type II secretion system GspH family protein [Campylobacter sp.]
MKKGFTLLELVLTIVVMAIGIAALPRIVIMSQQSNEMALKQELIFHAKSEALMMMKFPWDSAAYGSIEICKDVTDYKSCGDWNNKVPLHNQIANGDTTGDTANRLGIGPSRRGYALNATGVDTTTLVADANFNPTPYANFKAVSNGPDPFNDIDDFQNRNYRIRSFIDDGDFVTDARISVAVNYVSDRLINLPGEMNCNNGRNGYINSQKICIVFPAIDPTDPGNRVSNIKSVIITATDNNSTFSTVLRTFAFNIAPLGDNN